MRIRQSQEVSRKQLATDEREEIGYGKLSEYSVYSVEAEWQIYFPAWQASFRGRGTRESGKEAENERETTKENGRKRMRRREKERVRGRGSECSEKGCNKKEEEEAIGPPVSLLGIYNPMISFCTPAKPSHPRHRPWAKRSHGRVADIMVYCSQ